MATRLWWIIRKDLLSEYRARRAWPAMLLLGIVVAMMFSLQMQLPAELRPRIAAGLLWLAVFFSGTIAFDRALAGEREEGCWDALRLYPLSGTTLYLAKLAVNCLALAALELILIPCFAVLADVPLLAHPWAILLIAALANIGICALGTLISALTAGLHSGMNLSVLLLFPLAVPLLLAAAEATRLTVEGDLSATCWRWVQMLGALAIVFAITGGLLFDAVVEE